MSLPTEPTRPIPIGLDQDGSQFGRSTLTSTDFTVRACGQVMPELVAPIIYLPGIMGTLLRVKDRKDLMAWDLPNTMASGLVQVIINFLNPLRTPGKLQRLLDPNNTEVYTEGPCCPSPDMEHLLGPGEGKTPRERAIWRGWGQVHEASYQTILCTLEQTLAHCFTHDARSTLEAGWKTQVFNYQKPKPRPADKTASSEASTHTPPPLGAQKPFEPLDEAQLRTAALAGFPVHVVGYNWLQSNADSAKRLAEEITRITGWYAARGRICEKVIVVTHSMGGLVARACAQLPGMADKILGIVHGVQPAIGAPATYKRMRSGFEGPEQQILGKDAAECTAIMSHAPGPLELLPHASYRTKDENGQTRHWLHARHPDASGQTQAVPLGEGDPYDSIYLKNEEDCWWRLVKEELVDPTGDEERKKKKEPEDPNLDRFSLFANVLKKARDLTANIQDKYHSNTYAFYAADSARLAWNEVSWHGKKGPAASFVAAPLANDDLNGKVAIRVGSQDYKFEIEGAKGPGDGTVPAESGEALAPHCVQVFRHEGKAGGHTSYDHQLAFNAPEPIAVTLYSIARIAALHPWFKEQVACLTTT